MLVTLLFLIFINDIRQSIESIVKPFADDTSMSLGLTNPDRAEILASDLIKISDCEKLWNLKFNGDKTELVDIKRNIKPIPQLTFRNAVLEDKALYKHLGITI